MKIDDDALEVVRGHEDFRESKKTDRLFVIKPISEEGETYFVDLRDSSWSAYGYQNGDKVSLPDPVPRCVKALKSEIEAATTQTLDNF